MDRGYSIDEHRRMNVLLDCMPLDTATLVTLQFKIDTGADFTTISRSDLLKLGYDAAWIKTNGRLITGGASTADGNVAESYVIKFPLFNLSGLDFRSWPMFVLFDSVCECGKVTNRDYRNLLGNDVIDMFDLARYARRGSFELVPSPAFVISNKIFDDQVVDAITDVHQDATPEKQ